MSVIRLHIITEGRTEEAFVKRLLGPHLGAFDVFADARSVLTSKDKKAHKHHRGGLVSYLKAKADIQTWMKEDGHAECRFTTTGDTDNSLSVRRRRRRTSSNILWLHLAGQPALTCPSLVGKGPHSTHIISTPTDFP